MSTNAAHAAIPARPTLGPAEQALLDAAEFAAIATVNGDSTPQMSVVWVTRDGQDILVSSLEGRRKTMNLRRCPNASILVYYRSDPYHYLAVRGHVSVEPDPSGSLIQELSQRYTGGPYRDDAPGAARVILRLSPTQVFSNLPAIS